MSRNRPHRAPSAFSAGGDGIAFSMDGTARGAEGKKDAENISSPFFFYYMIGLIFSTRRLAAEEDVAMLFFRNGCGAAAFGCWLCRRAPRCAANGKGDLPMLGNTLLIIGACLGTAYAAGQTDVDGRRPCRGLMVNAVLKMLVAP